MIVARAGPTNWPIVCIVTFRRKVFDMYWDLFAGRMPWLTGNTQFTKSQFVFKQKQKHRLIEFTTSCKIMTRMQPFSLPRMKPNRRNASSLKQDRARLFTKVLDLEHKERDGMRDFVIFAMLKAERSMRLPCWLNRRSPEISQLNTEVQRSRQTFNWMLCFIF